jgi:mannosyltransferase
MAVTSWSSAAIPQVAKSKLWSDGEPRCQHLIALILGLTIYFCLAFYRIDYQSLWTDEVISVIRADPNGSFLARERWSDGHGPLYFRLLHLWAKLATSEFALRALSALFGGVTVCLTYAMGLRLYNRRVACIGAMLLATSPFLIWYSQEVRYVMLMMTAALLAMYTFHRALGTKRLGWWLLYCCSLILAIAAFMVNVFLPLAQGLYLVCSPSRRPVLRKWLVCQLVVLALFAWWANGGHVDRLGGYWRRVYVHFMTSDEQLPSSHPSERLKAGGSRDFTVIALPYTFFTFSAGFSLGPSVRELHVSRSLSTLWPHVLIISLCSLLFGSLFVRGFVAMWRRPDTGRFLTSWLAVPIIGVFGISAAIPDLAYNVRYVAMALPAYSMILSAGIAGFRRSLAQTILLAAVLLVNGLSLANYYSNPLYSREDARSAARFLEVATDPRDIIVVVGNAAALRYYYKGSSPLVRWGKKVIAAGSALTDRLRELQANHDHIWLVEIRPWEADPKGMVNAVLDNTYTRIEHKELRGVNIYLYRLQ